MNTARQQIGSDGRNETVLERCDRNLVELLQEVRVAQTGVQILFAFLLTVPFTARFGRLTSFQEILYFLTLLAAGAAALLLIAPTSYHRILFRLGDKEHLVRAANRLTIVGLAFVAVAIVGVILLISDLLFPGLVAVLATGTAAGLCVTCWYIVPLRRRSRLGGRPGSPRCPLPECWRDPGVIQLHDLQAGPAGVGPSADDVAAQTRHAGTPGAGGTSRDAQAACPREGSANPVAG